jgi:hypothetical protein
VVGANGIRPMEWHSPDGMAFARWNGIRPMEWHSPDGMAFARSLTVMTILIELSVAIYIQKNLSALFLTEKSVEGFWFPPRNKLNDRIALTDTFLLMFTNKYIS